jgi:hypothetical protein
MENSYSPVVHPPYNPQPNHVLPLYAVGTDPTCGCAADCGCGVPNVAKIAKQYNIPPDAHSLIDLLALNTFVDEVNAILVNSFMPPFPIMFLHFCIPFSPVCIMSYYANRGTKGINALLEKVNPTMRNCHW